MTERGNFYIDSAQPRAEILEKVRGYLNAMGLRDFSESELYSISDQFAKRLEENRKDPDSTVIVDSQVEVSRTSSLQPGKRAWIFEMGGSHFNGAETIVSERGMPQFEQAENGQLKHREVDITNREFKDAQQYLNAMLDNLDPLFAQGGSPDAVGIVYSFPGKPIRAPYGIDVISQEKLTKQFVIPGISKQPIGAALLAELRKRYGISPASVAVMNDTPAVLLSNQNSKIGGVVGTGANIAAVIEGKLYNTTAGAFMDVPTYPLFDSMDIQTNSAGVYFAQKQMGGMYLGGLFTETAKRLSNSGIINAQLIADLPSSVMSEILDGTGQKINNFYSQPLSAEEKTVLQHSASLLRNRSAQLFGTMLGTILKTLPANFADHEIVPVEGSVFWQMPGYEERAKAAAYRFMPNGKSIAFIGNKSASMLGVAAAALSVPTSF